MLKKLLVANRSEIAIRILRAANEIGMRTVAIFSEEDRFALHRFKADEAYQIGEAGKPLAAYLDIEAIIRIAKDTGADSIHPGYGFLAENPDFAEACTAEDIEFIGPKPEVLRLLGNKVMARELAVAAAVPVVPATEPLPNDVEASLAVAATIGYPLMLKASWGGGGRGMRMIRDANELRDSLPTARREAGQAFGRDEVYLEKLIERARHVEVQLLGDRHGNLVHLFERDCSMQRRNQKVVERAPAPYLTTDQRAELCEYALIIGRAAEYSHAGTVEFLMDRDTDNFYFIEVNPRIQVEHTVTEEVTGIDLVKAQIAISQNARIGDSDSGIPEQGAIRLNGHALQCRVTTEDPENDFVPDYGRIQTYRSASGFGVRLDAGTAYAGARITPFYDSLLVKITAWAPSAKESVARMDRALREFRIRGLTTNLLFLEKLINNPAFADGDYTTRFIDSTPELFRFPKQKDRASRLLRFVGKVIVNGNKEVLGRNASDVRAQAPLPKPVVDTATPGTKQRLDSLGATKFAAWMRDQKGVLITDTTMRDAHQSLLATRMRSYDLLRIADTYSKNLPGLFSVECWGGATFDVAMRFLQEDPWRRLRALRGRMPNLLLQMLLRSANTVGYTNYPDNVVRFFVQQAATAGIDVFRVFDSLNWVENMRVAMDAVIETGALCEGTICYSGNIEDAPPNKYDLQYYVKMAKALEKSGAHILGIKDMAGVCKPAAARKLITILEQEVGLPIHFHTHDTSGIAAASVIAAVEAGVDAIDAAMDSMSGLTSQPNLGSIVEALADDQRAPDLDPLALRDISAYWEVVRSYYAAFESDIRSGTADVYRHAMPGGQYTNLREQARALGIDHCWPEVAERYAQVNDLFGDIVKVTPSSKVVGDMALFMVTKDLSPEDVADPDKEIAFPESVVSLFRGDLGQPVGGFPKALSKKILKDAKPITVRPGSLLSDASLDAERAKVSKIIGSDASDSDLASHLMYPKVFADFAEKRKQYGDVSVLPTPVFFYGLQQEREVSVEIEAGKTLVIRYLGVSDTDEMGQRRVFFELNGQPRTIVVDDDSVASSRPIARKAEPGNANHVAAPMPGLVVTVNVEVGEQVKASEPLLTIEAMKMETALRAERDATVVEIVCGAGTQVETKDLLIVLA